jgi:hypothetical protein
MESPEAAHGNGCGRIAETRAADIRGTSFATSKLEGRHAKRRIQLRNASTTYLRH